MSHIADQTHPWTCAQVCVLVCFDVFCAWRFLLHIGHHHLFIYFFELLLFLLCFLCIAQALQCTALFCATLHTTTCHCHSHHSLRLLADHFFFAVQVLLWDMNVNSNTFQQVPINQPLKVVGAMNSSQLAIYRCILDDFYRQQAPTTSLHSPFPLLMRL